MTVVTTPDRQPFFGGTYLPRERFLATLRALRTEYSKDPEGVGAHAAEVVLQLRAATELPSPGGIPGREAIDAAVKQLALGFDPIWGGLGRAPKFPRPAALTLLLRHHYRTGDPQALRIVAFTLDRMAAGGIYDQVGGGFHRYSIDERWRVPHFEKMLYDNAQLAVLYLDMCQATGQRDFAQVAIETLDYLQRDMKAADGGFYSASDADSPAPGGESQEGYFFTWTPGEVEAAVGVELARTVDAFYGVTSTGDLDGRSVLHIARPLADVAASLGTDTGTVTTALARARPLLLAARAKRLPPHLDDKIVASWNGLAISAFARAALVLGREDYAATATRAAEFVLGKMRAPDGRLRRSYREGSAHQPATLDDYAFVIQGLLDLFEATAEPRWFDAALGLQQTLDTWHLDPVAGGYFTTASDGEKLIVRDKPANDGAEPSGNSVALLNLLRLATLTDDPVYRRRAESGFAAFGPTLQQGAAAPLMLAALDGYERSGLEVVVIAPHDRAEASPLVERVRPLFLPGTTMLQLDQATATRLAARVPLLEGKVALHDRPTAYVCERGSCQRPTNDPEELGRQIEAERQRARID